MTLAIICSASIGLWVSIVGVQFHGMGVDSAWLNWAAGAAAIVGLAFLPLALLATIEENTTPTSTHE